MKAAQINEYGDATKIVINELEKPIVSEGQVLVEVHASSINPFDITVRSGIMQQQMPLQLPVTLGGDIAGIVTEIGTGVSTVAVGDTVYGQALIVAGGSGAFAEFASTNASHIAIAPQNIDFLQAASLPLVGSSAWQALIKHINLTSGQKILITGGAGGIGTIAIQLAKHLGAHVVTTATGEGIAAVTKLGADEVVDYTVQDIADLSHDFDAVYDTVGGDSFDKALHLLKGGGIAVSMIAQPNEALATELQVTAMMQMTKVTTESLDALRGYVEQEIITPQVGAVFSLNDIVAAFQAKETNTYVGKIVIDIT